MRLCAEEREAVQKRTFSKWVNSHLERATPPARLDDLFLDLRDGRLLLRLLAVLSGEMLVRVLNTSSALPFPPLRNAPLHNVRT